MKTEETKKLIETAVRYAVENMHANLDYHRYVAHDYQQKIDGKTFDREAWAAHMRMIKELMISQHVSFDHIVAENDAAAASFVVTNIKKDGSQLKVKVISYFRVRDGKIIYVDELTHLIEGDEKDKNIGSLS